VAHWYGGALSRPEAEGRASEFAEGWRTRGVHKWMAYDRHSGELIGRGGLSWVHVDGAERLEVGWALRDHCQGQGFATEIGRAALQFAFDDLGVDEVVAYTEPHNARSRAVMERLGMHYSHEMEHEGEVFVLYRRTHPDRGTISDADDFPTSKR
jgi:RimJ/RimL family protein N-acetyltransferase